MDTYCKLGGLLLADKCNIYKDGKRETMFSHLRQTQCWIATSTGKQEETNSEQEAVVDDKELEISCEMENKGEITNLKPGELGLAGFPACMDPSDKNDKIVREWRAHVKMDEIPAKIKPGLEKVLDKYTELYAYCLLYTSPSPRD